MRKRFDEIRRAFGEWSAAEGASRAAAGLPEMHAASDRAWKIALDLRRRVATTPARTLAGMLAKLGALTAVQGVEVIDDELDLAIAQPELEVDALFFSVARDCAHLAEQGAITPTV